LNCAVFAGDLVSVLIAGSLKGYISRLAWRYHCAKLAIWREILAFRTLGLRRIAG
jgi:hypothetical protein